MVERDGAGGQGRRRRQLPPAQPRVPRPLVEFAGNRKLTAIYRTPGQRTVAVPAPATWPTRRLLPISAARAPRHRQGHRRPATPTPPAARCYDHVMDSKERTLRNNRAAATRADGRTRRAVTSRKVTRCSTSTAGATRLPRQPTVVVCVDGCEPDYIAQAVAGGHTPWLKRMLAAGHGADRRLRGAELHQPEQPVDRDRRAAVGARHLRQLLLRRRERHRSHDERPEVAARADASSRRSPTPAPAVAVVTAKDKLRPLLGHGMKGICFSSEKADQVDAGRERHRRRAVAGRHAGARRLQRRAVGVRVRRRRAADARRARPDVMYLSTTDYVQHKHAPGTAGANALLRDDGRLPRAARRAGLRRSRSPPTTA